MLSGQIRRLFSSTAFLFLLLLQITSCSTPRNYTYFRDIPDSFSTKFPSIPLAAYQDPVIKASDLLQVSIITIDPQENAAIANGNTAVFPLQVGSSGFSSGQPVPAVQVNGKGFIELPVIGSIHVAGLTTAQAKDTIYFYVSKYYKSATVSVRFANFSITVLGEVTKPGTFTIPNEKVSVLDALGMAGDLTIFGKRENILLVRDSADHKELARFDLNSSKTLQSPFFYLKPGDILYVEPDKAKAASVDAVKTRNYALIASALTVLIILISRL